MTERERSELLATLWADVYATTGALSDAVLDEVRRWRKDASTEDFVRLLRAVHNSKQEGTT